MHSWPNTLYISKLSVFGIIIRHIPAWFCHSLLRHPFFLVYTITVATNTQRVFLSLSLLCWIHHIAILKAYQYLLAFSSNRDQQTRRHEALNRLPFWTVHLRLRTQMSDLSPGDEVPSRTYTFSHEEDKSVRTWSFKSGVLFLWLNFSDSQLQENIYTRPNERNDSFSDFDPNIDFDADSILGKWEQSSNVRKSTHNVVEEDSPYPEVRSAVANFDDPDMPVSTIRAWVSLIYCAQVRWPWPPVF